MIGPIPVLVLFGPTASGKTAVLERLFASSGKRFEAEVVSADSMQVYRRMDIGTAKPSADLLSRLPHHLIDIRNPDEPFCVGDFVRLADEACSAIRARGRLPVVAGGTGFYLKHFVLGLAEAPPADPAVRAEVREELSRFGAEKLHAELARADPASAARIHLHDEYRLTRALEVFRASGRPLSSYAASSSAGRPAYRFLSISVERERPELYRRIDERARAMFASGLPAEVEALRKAGYGPDAPALRAIGYREFFLTDAELSAELPESFPASGGTGADRLAAIEALVARNSRRYAKRQITFASSIPGMEPLRADAGDDDLSAALERKLASFLAGT